MVPEDAANKVVMVRANRNTAAVSLEDAGEVILFPSGKKFLTVSYDTQTYEKPPLVTVYDALTLAQLDQFDLEPAKGMTTIFGFSADENQIFFGGNDGYAYDMQTHQVTQLRRSEDALGMEYHQPQSSQAPGEPVISVIFGGLENPNEMYWYRNLEKAGSFVFPCEAGEEIYPDWPNWYIGANGLIVCSAYSEENVELTETFVYSTRDGVCRRVPNPARELGYGNIGVANVEQLVAFANADGIIRIYDFHQDAVVRSYPLPVSPGEVSALQFVGQDQYLLVFKRNGSLTVLDAADGTVLQELLLDDPVSQYNEYVIEDSANQQLYICTAYGSHSGYRIDMQTWEVLAEIPGMSAFLPESGQILQRDYYTGKLLASPVYSLEELMTQTRTVLDQT